ncbi:Hypothetical predicted protein [Cloeon dipterum]|uniref:Transcription factor IIIC subunit 5 HTH domain-containing protein n=2 Tax=Cloeon dipterum TaxID=197152 RepID=A0A8S1BU17_9INSE|nr:Hypothetical predicted protein [Cloeon dipterum]
MTQREVNHDFNSEISCVKFPGIVKDSGVQQAIQALGGNAALSQAFSRGQKLELNFNPDSMFHKPTYGDLEKTDAVLMRVKKKSGEATVVGVIKDSYSFKNLCDFQFLPPGDPDTTVFPLSTVANPKTLMASDVEPPLYLTAMNLSRMDVPSMYSFSNRSLITSGRVSRRNHTQRVPFSMTAQFPNERIPGAIKLAKIKDLQSKVNAAEDLFKKRPLWTRAAILSTLNIDKYAAIVILPCVSFFFLGGPWRLTWCRHGYDPRKDPDAKMWQTIEFRAQSLELRKHLRRRFDEKDDYIFKEGDIPSQVNSLYQLIDIHVKEIQDLLVDSPFKTCHEKYGWITAATTDKIRKIIDEKANEAVIAKYGRSLPANQTEDQEDSDDSLMVLSNKDSDTSEDAEDFTSDDDD